MKTINVKHMGLLKIDKYKRKKSIKLKYIETKTTEQIKKLIGNFDYLKTFLNIENTQKVYEVNPKELLSPINYDIFVKYLFFKDVYNKFAKRIYLNHIRAFNNFKEPDGSKTNKKDYLDRCNYLLNNYHSINTIIPISNQGIIIDGSHRIALSILNNNKIICTNFKTEDLFFDFTFFYKRGFKKKYCDYIGFTIIELLDDIACIVMHFNTKEDLKKRIQEMKTKYDVYYYKKKHNDIIFLFSGFKSKKILEEEIIFKKKEIINEYSKFVSKKIKKRYEEESKC